MTTQLRAKMEEFQSIFQVSHSSPSPRIGWTKP